MVGFFLGGGSVFFVCFLVKQVLLYSPDLFLLPLLQPQAPEHWG